jgi:hypothetical protein
VSSAPGKKEKPKPKTRKGMQADHLAKERLRQEPFKQKPNN